MDKWIKLSSTFDKVIDYRGKTPKKLGKDWSKSGYRALSALNVKTNGLSNLMDIKYGDDELYKIWMKDEIEKGDILLTSEAPAGQVMVWESDEKIILSQRLFALRINSNFNNYFVKYFLQSSIGQNEIFKNTSGSTVSGISAKIFDLINFPDKKLKEQTKIGKTLKILDDKIELNNNINAELEQMAKILYDYWFVQFDFPNEDGKPYKSSGGKMIYNNILTRKIPEGWKINTLSEINSELIRGISPKYSEDKGIPVINQRCIRNNTVDFSLCRLHNVELKPVKKLIEIGDILVNSTGVGTLGRVAIVKRLENSQTTVDSHVTIVRANTNLVNPLYLGFSLVSKQVEIEKLGEGSTGQTELSRENLGKLQILLPKRDIQDNFASIIKPLFEKIAINEKQNQELTSLRDWLLPMLMNGQVKVVD